MFLMGLDNDVNYSVCMLTRRGGKNFTVMPFYPNPGCCFKFPLTRTWISDKSTTFHDNLEFLFNDCLRNSKAAHRLSVEEFTDCIRIIFVPVDLENTPNLNNKSIDSDTLNKDSSPQTSPSNNISIRRV